MAAQPTILIVEDDQATHWLYERALQQEYRVLVASTAESVSAVLRTHTPLHAIVLEPGPLGSWGWALMAELKRNPSFEAVPLIVCTAQDERRRGLELGATVYLVKPVLPADLLATVRRLAPSVAVEGEP